MKFAIAAGLSAALSMGSALAEETVAFSPPTGNSNPTNVYFGDLHLHSRNSPDAYQQDNTTLSPDLAYRYAKGAEILAHNGMKVRLHKPLDFLSVTDHSEYLGISYRLGVRDPDLLSTEWAEHVADLSPEEAATTLRGWFTQGILEPDNKPPMPSAEYRRTIWAEVAATADRHNEPGKFTAFTGYEWTSMIDGNNLHRCVIFEDSQAKLKDFVPFSSHDSTDPEDLWAALAAFEEETSGTALSIPHNGNISGGMMWAEEDLDGRKIDKAYAKTRMRWEPIVEMTQVKGDGESHPILSPTDEFADYENWDKYNIMGTHELTPEQLPGSYARSALKRGLKIEERTGANPYAFGMIGSTDGHNTFTTMREDNFFGKFPGSEPAEDRSEHKMAGGRWNNWRLTSSGLAAVWAEENTREALIAAMKRKEVYSTTGSRITVRFFGGWDYAPDDVLRADYVARGYAGGVPMGGSLSSAEKDTALRFMVVAAKDPDNANLDRVQIVKGWLDKKGELHEKVYDVALSDGRELDENGKTPPVGSTVDIEDASYVNSIGDAHLAAVWTDPDFNRKERAFYYARVIEIPKPRWTAYDAKYFGTKMADDVPMTVQDRAYTSPIWYTP